MLMLEIRNLQKVKDGKTVIDIPSFDVIAGQIVGLVGRSGSGSETLVSLITGRAQPSSGTIRLTGLNPYSERLNLSQVLGVLFAEDTVYKNLSTQANLQFQARLHGLPKEYAVDVLRHVGLADQASLPAGKLSPSLLRRLAFGRAILHTPKLLLLIEPFSRCDEATVGLLSAQMRKLADEGSAILVLADDAAGLVTLCDLLYELQDGRIAAMDAATSDNVPSQIFKIPVKAEDKVLLLNPVDILYADASGDRAYLVTAEGRLPTQYTLTELEKRLARSGFFRAHRSYLVNLQHVKEVIPFTRNAFSLCLDNPEATQIPLSKSAASELRDLLGY
jgi:ABC-2 type transport system ATP-binding protein